MSWHRAATLLACGFLLQCTSNVNTSRQQSYREALRRRLSTVAWCPPPSQSPRVVVPYPYLPSSRPTPRAHSGTNNIISQSSGWPEYRIKLPLYMGRPVKTNIIIELPLFMFPQPGQADAVNITVTTSTTTSGSGIDYKLPNAQVSSQNEEDQKTSTLIPKHASKQEDLAECNPEEIIKNDSSEFPEYNTPDNDPGTDKSDDSCYNDSPSSSTNHIENQPSIPEPGNEANNQKNDECNGATPNEPIETTTDCAHSDSASVENIPESSNIKDEPEESSISDTCELISNNDPKVESNQETSGDIPYLNGTDKSEDSCYNDSPSSSTNHIENQPSIPEPGNEANDECNGATPNEPIETTTDCAHSDSASVENIPESSYIKDEPEDSSISENCELISNNDPKVESNQKTSGDIPYLNGTDKREDSCYNDSPSSSTNHIENQPSIPEPGNEANDECNGATPNEPIETTTDCAHSDSASVENIPESSYIKDEPEDSSISENCELISNKDPKVENNQKTSVDTPYLNAAEKVTRDDGAIEPHPQTEDGTLQYTPSSTVDSTDSEYTKNTDATCSTEDDTDATCCTEDDTEATCSTEDNTKATCDTKTEECLESITQPEGETIVTENATEFSSPRTDDGTEIASSGG